ncbi:hypothetical protein [Actinoallomurus sp. CA-150999]|uniref:hypothetical protein n=1 Tax=Actinoallomurus sp. CA-150999 TaxID=3239887 RepID=UPI003D8DA29A
MQKMGGEAPRLSEHHKAAVRRLLARGKRAEAIEFLQAQTGADGDTCRELVKEMERATPPRRKGRAQTKAKSGEESVGKSLLGCLGMIGFVLVLIVFFVAAIFVLGRLRGGVNGISSGEPLPPYAVSIPVTVVGLAFVLFVGPLLLRRLGGIGPKTAGVPDSVRALGVVPMLLLIPLLIVGGPKRPAHAPVHATSGTELLVVFLGILASVPPILAAISSRWWVVTGSIVIWLAWAIAVYNTQYGLSAIPACIQVLAGIAVAFVLNPGSKTAG